MFKKLLKNKQFVALLVLLSVFILGTIIFLLRPRNPDREVKGADDRKGSTIEYKEGKITKKTFGGLGSEDVYSVGFLPTLTIKDSGNKVWEVTESILNDKENSFNSSIIFKSDELNIVFSIINNNRTLEAGKTCFSEDELVKISDVWTREKMIDVSSQQTGFIFMKNDAYLPKTDSTFNALYEEYVKYQNQLSLPSKEKLTVTACSTAARMNVIDIQNSQGRTSKGLIRLFYNKGSYNYTPEDIKRIDTFVKNISF
jgi:hypothetical protein